MRALGTPEAERCAGMSRVSPRNPIVRSAYSLLNELSRVMSTDPEAKADFQLIARGISIETAAAQRPAIVSVLQRWIARNPEHRSVRFVREHLAAVKG